MDSIGLIGRGVVGEAVLQGMMHAFRVNWYDNKTGKTSWPYDGLYNHRCNYSVESVVNEVDGPIFLCLPTPMNGDGFAHTSIIESVVDQINKAKKYTVVIIKSTVPPGTTEMLNTKYENVSCVFNPEFLRESSAIKDFKCQEHIIIGGPDKAASVVKRMYLRAYPEVPTTKTTSVIAEMVKYVENCFLATKVAFANEIYQICEKLDVDYDKVIECITKDKRLGTSHWAVPGPDGHFGFGLTCFPKDLNALISVAKNLAVDPKVMKAVWEKNLEVRPERDWEKLKGRAIL